MSCMFEIHAPESQKLCACSPKRESHQHDRCRPWRFWTSCCCSCLPTRCRRRFESHFWHYVVQNSNECRSGMQKLQNKRHALKAYMLHAQKINKIARQSNETSHKTAGKFSEYSTKNLNVLLHSYRPKPNEQNILQQFLTTVNLG